MLPDGLVEAEQVWRETNLRSYTMTMMVRFASEKAYAVVLADFDPVRGYPTEVLIDRRAEADHDHVQLWITSLEPLAGRR